MKNIKSFKKDLKEMHRLKVLAKRCYTKLENVEVTVCKSREPIAPGQEESLTYTPIRPGEVWAPHVYDCAWFHVTGKTPSESIAAGSALVLKMDIGGEGTVYENHQAVQMITCRAMDIDDVSAESGKCIIELSDAALSKGSFDLYIDAGYNGYRVLLPFGFGVFHYAYLAIAHDEWIDAYYDYLAAASLKTTLSGSEKQTLQRTLDQAYSLFLLGDIAKARTLLQEVIQGEAADFSLSAIGHSHLDLAWLWPIRETRRKSIRTFTMQLNNLEKYPEYVYGASQPWQYEQLQKTHPELFEKIRKAIAEGRIEPQGGMYVEADTNLSGGEALIRQIHYGKEYFQKEFGKDMSICWLPDVFGYNGNLPQILKKCGVPYFFTIKLSWNEHNRFPHRSFIWKGIDGSDVLVHMAPSDDYSSDGSPISTQYSLTNFPEKNVSKEALYVFGNGDGGGGASHVHLELLKRQQQMKHTPRVRFESAASFFDRLNLQRNTLPDFHGELYLEKHQGTYTTQGANKKLNRTLEYALQDLEALASFAMLKGAAYPQEDLDRWWKEVLLYQFHDIIPGSSIHRVYKESVERYHLMLSEIDQKKQELLTFLSGTGDKDLVFNPVSFERSGAASWGFAEADAPSQDAASMSPNMASTSRDAASSSNLVSADGILSNGILTARFNSHGEIISLKDASGEEYSGGILNRFKCYFDPPLIFNAWDIWWKYPLLKGKTIKAHRPEFILRDDKAVCLNHYRFGRSSIMQEISLKKGEDVLHFETTCDWHSLFKMLRVEFDAPVDPDQVRCDIQLGSLMRSARDNTPEEKAQFEICAHKYVDLSDDQKGFSLLNDCKYGHRVKNGLISLNLLRSPVFPDPKADRGQHTFAYEIYPHKGASDVKTIQRAYALNKPLCTFKGATVPAFSVESSNPDIILETIKKSSEGKDIVVRLYESSGTPQTTSLSVPFSYEELMETDMLEKNPSPADITTLSFTPFETKTLLFRHPTL